MVKRIRGTIKYKVMRTHPDFDCIPDYEYGKEFEYSDVYTFDTDYFPTIDSQREYMKRDLRLTAGGGYNADHIYGERFEFQTVDNKEVV